MVQLEEVLDEDFKAQQAGPQDDEEGWDTDSGMRNERRAAIDNYAC